MWEQIRSNRRRSFVVVTAMGLVLVGAGMALGVFFAPSGGGALAGGSVALTLWLIMWLVTISQGDNIMLRMAGAREVEKKDHSQLVNVVEEMSIAASLPTRPRIYIVDDPSPNAFATGRNPRNAAVSVTTGLLAILNRDELQGVVAHEVGHIKNRDVALMTTAGVMVGCVVLLAEIGLRAMWFSGGGHRRSRSSNDNDAGQVIAMVLGVLFLILAPILAQLIYFSLSRRREYLADASAAMFTRYPHGLASALEKLGGASVPLADTSRVTAPMYIVKPLRADAMQATSAFATHPPLAERIRILRTMAGGAGLDAYNQAYQGVKHKSIVGKASLEQAGQVKARKRGKADFTKPEERHRQASDAYLTASGYERRSCQACQALIKVPPSLRDRLSRCPRCRAELTT